MKLAIFGSSIVSAYWNGAATYYRGMCAALHARGHQIRFVEQDIFQRQQHRDFVEDPSYCDVRVVSGWDAIERELRAASKEADLIIKCNDTGALDREMEEWLVGSAGLPWPLLDLPPVAFWDVDAAATLAECAGAESYLRPLIPSFACIFTYGGGETVVNGYTVLGARRVVPVYNAVDPVAYRPVTPVEEYECDLFFMASRMPDREERFRHFFLEAAQRAPDARFLLGGPGWEDIALPPNVRAIGYCPTPLHPVMISSARFVLNLNRDAMAAAGFSPPTRVFEAAACSACVITDAWEGVDHFFTPGDEILVASGPDDLVRYLTEVERPQARAIGERARQRALRDHTYASRAATFERAALALLGGASREAVSVSELERTSGRSHQAQSSPVGAQT